MEQRTAIKFYVKLKEIATETFVMLKSAYDEARLSSAILSDWRESSKKGESRYKTMNEKTVLRLPEQKNLCRKNRL
jgi:hypothetical protein